MSKELNQRAAKALKWPPEDLGGSLYCYQPPLEISHRALYPNQMHFKSSYDWAWLGIKRCVDLGFSIHEIEDNLGSYIFESSPEEITRAWVEVLESQQ